MARAPRSKSLGLWATTCAALLGSALLLLVGAVALTAHAPAAFCNPECLPPPTTEEKVRPPRAPALPKILVVDLGWDTGNSSTTVPVSESMLNESLAYLRNDTNHWFAESAPGIAPQWAVYGGGSYMVPAPARLFAEGGCNNVLEYGYDAFAEQLFKAGDTAVSAAGYDLSIYDVVVYVWSRPICGFSGIADSGLANKHIGLQNVTSAQHELGHHLGLPHANALYCTDANGHFVTLSNECHPHEYDDPYDMMGGYADGLFNVIFQNGLGWLGNEVVNVTAGDFSGTWTLKPLSEPGQSPRALRLVDGPATLWLEYRVPTGLESPALTGAEKYNLTYGLLIHREIPSGKKIPFSALLDMTPGSRLSYYFNQPGGPEDFRDAALPVGQTWANPLGEMSITLDHADASGATVTISSQRVTVPEVRGLSASQAAEAMTATGFRVLTAPVPDPTCAYIGVVAQTSPSAGARVFPGTQVTLGIGERDPTRECQ